MRCLGLTKHLSRCKKEARIFFCHHHRYQPIALLIGLLSALGLLAGIYQDFWKPFVAPGKADVEPDPLIEAAYVDYVYPPVYDYWKVTDAQIPKDEKSTILEVLKLFQVGDFAEAREKLNILPEKYSFVKEFKKNYIVAILMKEGQYVEAIRKILERYEGRPVADVSQRWELAYVIYYFRRIKGLEACEKGISRLREEFPRNDLSYVWMAVDPGAHCRLLELDARPEQDLHPVQQEILHHVISEHPEDAFIDHAYYFLHQYERVIENFPNSLILDRAYYAAAYIDYHHEILKPKRPASDPILLQIAERYWVFIEKYPVHQLTCEAASELSHTLMLLTDADSRIGQLKQLLIRLNNLQIVGTTADYLPYVIRRSILKICNVIPSLDSEAEKLQVVELLSQFVELPNYEEARLLIADIAFEMNRFDLAYTIYSMYNDSFDWDKNKAARLEAAKRIHDCGYEPGSGEYIFEVAMALKNDAKEPKLALAHLDNYLEHYARPDEVPMILMLKAFCFRDMERGAEMVELYQEIVDQYPDHYLADDALAEIGVYYLLWEWDYEDSARIVFDQVIKRYPDRNAVDNCYNWIAWSYLTNDMYKEARDYYSEIRRRFPGTRFKKYADKNIHKIDSILSVMQIPDEP